VVHQQRVSEDGTNDRSGPEGSRRPRRRASAEKAAPPPQASPSEKHPGGGASPDGHARLRENGAPNAPLPTHDHLLGLTLRADAVPGQPLTPLEPVGKRLNSLTQVWRGLQPREEPVITRRAPPPHRADSGSRSDGAGLPRRLSLSCGRASPYLRLGAPRGLAT
jgi:hypothetical protein